MRLPDFDPWRPEDRDGLIAVVIQALILVSALLMYLFRG